MNELSSIRASLLAVVVGILGGVLAVLTKVVVGALRHGVVAVVTSWPIYALLVVGAAGIYVQQLSFQAGALQASLPEHLTAAISQASVQSPAPASKCPSALA